MKSFIQRLAVVGLVVGLFLIPTSVDAASRCCSYTVDPASKAPQWLKNLGDGATFLKTADKNGNCTDSGNTVPVSVFASSYDQSFFDGACVGSNEYTSTQQVMAPVKCCILTDASNNGIACKDRSAGATETCIELLHTTGKMTSATQVTHGVVACNQIEACKTIGKTQPTQSGGGSAQASSQTTASSQKTGQNSNADKRVWTREECESVEGKNGGSAYMWIPPKTDPTADRGAHCYVKPIPTNLQIGIGNTFTITGLNEYINTAYKYTLGFGVLLLVITIMVSGIQWMVSGVAGSINDAKERIQNALIGLLLLFFANVLLYTINPQLTRLQAPLMHAVKPEQFMVAKEDPRCDPSVADSCSKLGTGYVCKPTGFYVSQRCQEQANVFLGVTFGGAAIAATAPFAISGISAMQGFPRIAQEAAGEVASQVVSGNKDANTSGKHSAIINAVSIATGLAVADLAFGTDGNTEPASGYCVIPKPDKPDMSVCQFDGECVSGRCLLTSSGACGAGKFGVCTSGQLRQACITGTVSDTLKNTIGLGNLDEMKSKFGCKSGSCVNNGRGAGKDGIGMCSDGSGVGMACSDDVPCNNLSNALECVNGFCREKGYFSTDKSEGMMIKSDEYGPVCVLPTDCNDMSKSQALFMAQGGTNLTGCMKPPSKDLGLPGRYLIPQLNGKITPSFYAELNTTGVCVIDKATFKNPDGSSVAQTCYVNLYPTPKNDSHVGAIIDYLNKNNAGLTGTFSERFDIKKVGCGTKGVCYVTPTAVANAQIALNSTSFISVKGSCGEEFDDNSPAKLVVKNGQTFIGVLDSDKWFDRVLTPNIVDLQYTSAGTIK